MVCSTKITTCFRLSNLRLWNLEKLITSALRKPRARAPAITCPATSPATSSECTTVNGSDRRDGTSEPPRVSAGPGRSTVVGSGGLPIAPVDCPTSSLACTASAIARAVSSYSVFCGTPRLGMAVLVSVVVLADRLRFVGARPHLHATFAFTFRRPVSATPPAVTMVNFTVEQLRQVGQGLNRDLATKLPLRFRAAAAAALLSSTPCLPASHCQPRGSDDAPPPVRPTARPHPSRSWTSKTTFVRCP